MTGAGTARSLTPARAVPHRTDRMGTESPHAAASAPPLLAVRGLVVERPGMRVTVDALDVEAGGVVAILGPSGSGKSSLVAALLDHLRSGEDLRVTGSVRFAGEERPSRGSDAWRAWLRGPVVTIPQDARGALDPLQPIGRQIAELAGVPEVAARAALVRLRGDAADALFGRRPHQVSGGEAQSALLAVALARPSVRLCVLDEPSAGLDAERVEAVVAAVSPLHDAGTAVLVATHDLELARRLSARPLHLGPDGRLCTGWPETSAFPSAAPAAEDAPLVLEARDVGLVVRGVSVLESASVTLRRGQSLAVRGPSGAGKTSLCRVLVGRVEPTSGTVERRGKVLLLDQDAAGSLTPHRTIASLCAESAAPGFDVEAEADRLGLGTRDIASTTSRLSGGQRRRAALLRALAARPDVLVLDEPTAGLDRDAAVRVVETLLAAQQRHGLALLWITHDEDLAHAVSGNATVLLRRGRTC